MWRKTANPTNNPCVCRHLRALAENILGPCESLQQAQRALRYRLSLIHPDKMKHNSNEVFGHYCPYTEMRGLLDGLGAILREPTYANALFSPGTMQYGRLRWRDAVPVGIVCGVLASAAVGLGAAAAPIYPISAAAIVTRIPIFSLAAINIAMLSAASGNARNKNLDVDIDDVMPCNV